MNTENFFRLARAMSFCYCHFPSKYFGFSY